jgi:hypothetical protein
VIFIQGKKEGRPPPLSPALSRGFPVRTILLLRLDVKELGFELTDLRSFEPHGAAADDALVRDAAHLDYDSANNGH